MKLKIDQSLLIAVAVYNPFLLQCNIMKMPLTF